MGKSDGTDDSGLPTGDSGVMPDLMGGDGAKQVTQFASSSANAAYQALANIQQGASLQLQGAIKQAASDAGVNLSTAPTGNYTALYTSFEKVADAFSTQTPDMLKNGGERIWGTLPTSDSDPKLAQLTKELNISPPLTVATFNQIKSMIDATDAKASTLMLPVAQATWGNAQTDTDVGVAKTNGPILGAIGGGLLAGGAVVLGTIWVVGTGGLGAIALPFIGAAVAATIGGATAGAAIVPNAAAGLAASSDANQALSLKADDDRLKSKIAINDSGMRQLVFESIVGQISDGKFHSTKDGDVDVSETNFQSLNTQFYEANQRQAVLSAMENTADPNRQANILKAQQQYVTNMVSQRSTDAIKYYSNAVPPIDSQFMTILSQESVDQAKKDLMDRAKVTTWTAEDDERLGAMRAQIALPKAKNLNWEQLYEDYVGDGTPGSGNPLGTYNIIEATQNVGVNGLMNMVSSWFSKLFFGFTDSLEGNNQAATNISNTATTANKTGDYDTWKADTAKMFTDAGVDASLVNNIDWMNQSKQNPSQVTELLQTLHVDQWTTLLNNPDFDSLIGTDTADKLRSTLAPFQKAYQDLLPGVDAKKDISLAYNSAQSTVTITTQDANGNTITVTLNNITPELYTEMQAQADAYEKALKDPLQANNAQAAINTLVNIGVKQEVGNDIGDVNAAVLNMTKVASATQQVNI